jgi:hypothetical protein
MSLFHRKPKVPKKPKKFIDLNAGPLKIQVHDTNDTQYLLERCRSHMLNGTSGVAVALCARTPEQIEANYPNGNCVNVCMRNSKAVTGDNWLGYIDVDRAGVGYIKGLCDEYQLVEAHAKMTEKDGKYRMAVVVQRPENRKKKK